MANLGRDALRLGLSADPGLCRRRRRAAGAFIPQERHAAEPVLPLRLFRDPVFVSSAPALFIATLCFFAAIVFLPLFLQS